MLPKNTTASKLAAAGQGGDTRQMLFLSVALLLFLLLAERGRGRSALLSHLKLRRHLDDPPIVRIVLISALCLYVFIPSRYIDIVVIFLCRTRRIFVFSRPSCLPHFLESLKSF